jgi:hypothetical protein
MGIGKPRPARRGGAGSKGRCRRISSRIVAGVRLAVLYTWTDARAPGILRNLGVVWAFSVTLGDDQRTEPNQT